MTLQERNTEINVAIDEDVTLILVKSTGISLHQDWLKDSKYQVRLIIRTGIGLRFDNGWG